MLPDVLFSAYLEYKRDTDSIASWLASTAKAAGFNTGDLSAPPSQSSTGGGRLKGKARKQAKKVPSKPAPASSAKYIIRIRDFTTLAQYILEKAIAVPRSFQSTLDRAITARTGFGAKLAEYDSSIDAEADAKHENFVDVLRHVRVILTSLMPLPNDAESSTSVQDDALPSRFGGLTVYEPSEAFVSAPDIQRPTKPEADPVDYAAETPASLEDTIFGLWVLMDDMNRVRASIRSIWTIFKDGGFEIVPAAVTTNTAIELVRNMIEDVLPLVNQHGGLKECIQKCYVIGCLLKGFSLKEIEACRDLKDNFNYDTYDVANETFFMSFRLIDSFQAIIHPRQIPLYRDGIFGTFDVNSDRTKKSGTSKFHDDRALLMPFFTDLITVTLSVPNWPVHDEFLRGMKEMTRTGSIPFYMVFAAQVFLDVTYTLGPDIERVWTTFNSHTNFIAGDLKLYFDYHANLKIRTWAASNEQMIKQLRDSILWLGQDPLFKIHEPLLKREGVKPNKDNLHRIFRMSPILCGLVLYQCRFRYREAGMAVADAWGSIQYAGHLYNTLQGSRLLMHRWEDMDIAKTILGPESFFVGGEEPKTLGDQFKKYCLQMGVSAAALGKKDRKDRPLASKKGPRGLKLNAPVTTMFEERYANDSDIVLTTEQVNRIIELSEFEMETDEETGQRFLGQIEDAQRLKDKKKLQYEIKNHAKDSKATNEPRVSLGQLTEALANALQAETIEFSFPYMMMHRWCWRLFRAVRDSCDSELRQILGPDYLENESQLPTLTGYILMLACGAEGRELNLGPMKSAAFALGGMLETGAGKIVTEKTLKGILGMEVEIVDETDD